MNIVCLVGNLGQDPELRFTQNQTAVCNFSVATSEKKKDGKEEVTWHNIVTWEKTAENCKKFLSKGKKVAVTGKITTRTWEDKVGVKHYKTEIVAHHVEFLTPRTDAEKQEAPQEQFSPPPSALDDIPF